MTSRRDVLRAAGLAGVASLAGCTAIADDGPLPAPDESGPGTRPSDHEHPPDATHRVEIAGMDDAPDLPVRPSVSLADPYATGGSPPALRVDVANPTDQPVTIGEYRSVVFQYVPNTTRTLVLLPHSERSTDGPPDRVTPDHPVEGEGCWRLTEGIAMTMEYGTVEIPANGTLTAYVGLYGDESASACLPTGVHRFEAPYTHFPEGFPGDGETPSARWGFELAVAPL